ncbi:hypothetical protein KFL_000670040 [Klebsormidium nitens]|uniref:Peroxisomal membrane protein PEX14 n=1 Tax=Klebsormidium nitens TaxID=105231 RepID=A0A1Y1HWR3_KLENI|nr:hypothetical protein KFL_000670040 [Klebsormidium nitens]|eukprot:GAQ80946.1 hypothetical protein KFL_000670040 [Klebsormidium nitens]
MADIPSAPPVVQAEEISTTAEVKTPLPDPPATLSAEAAPIVEENLPLREDFIQNAVKFLSHPKVQGSPVQYRRSFLEKKGLNSAEITEAFRRVPDTATAPPAPLPATTTVTTTTTSPAPPAPTASPVAVPPRPAAVLRKPWEQTAQPASAYPAAGQQVAAAPQAQVAPRQGVRWTQMVLALGVLSAAGAGTVIVTKQYLVPRLRAWLRRWLLDISEEVGGVRKLTPVEEAANAAAAAASAAAEATKIMKEAREEVKEVSAEGDRKLEAILGAFQAQTRELTATLGSLKGALEEREEARKEALILGTASHPEGAPPVSLPDLRKELLKFTSVMTGFTGTPPANEAAAAGLSGADVSELKALVLERRAAAVQAPRGPAVDREYEESEDGLNWLQSSQTASQNDLATAPRYDSASKGPVNTSVDRRALGTTAAGRAGPANQGLAMQPASASMEPRYEDANGYQEKGSRPTSANSMPLSQVASGQELPHRPTSSPAQGPDHAPHSQSYMDVLQMLKDGKPIPGIRDIDDKPPNPNQPPTDPKLKPRAKPWEKGFQQVSEKPANGEAPPPFNITNSRSAASPAPVYSSDGQAPWWRKAQPLSQPGVSGPPQGQDGYPPRSTASGAESESFVHPALAGDIDPPRPQAVQSELASGSAPADPSSGPRITEVHSEPVEAQAVEAQPGPSSSRSTSGAGGSQGTERPGLGTGVPAVPSKPAWRPPAVPGFAMPSAAEAIKGKGKVVPVTPMASNGHREVRAAATGEGQGEGSSQSGSVEGTDDRFEKSYAGVVQAGGGSQENEGMEAGGNAE